MKRRKISEQEKVWTPRAILTGALIITLLLLVYVAIAPKGEFQARYTNNDVQQGISDAVNTEQKGTIPQQDESKQFSFIAYDNYLDAKTLQEQVKSKYNGFIIQLNEPSVIEKTKQWKQGSLGEAAILQKAQEYKSTLVKRHNSIKARIKAVLPQAVVKNEYYHVFNGFALKASDEDIKKIKDIVGIRKIFRNYKVNATLMDSVPLINADDVWNMGYTGKNVKIAIVDTGIDYTHPDLGGCFGLGCKVADGYDFVNNDNDPMDDQGHGTHVAGIAAANGNLKGVAPDAVLYVYKVLDEDGSGDDSWIIAGIEQAVLDGADIISMSLGVPYIYFDDCYEIASSIASDNAVDAGVIVVVAAANSGPFYQTIAAPGCAQKVITVGASFKDDVMAGFSSRGPTNDFRVKPDITAPGANICSTKASVLEGRTCYDDNHVSLSGTSMATPHVAGAAALLMDMSPFLSPEEIKAMLSEYSVDIGELAASQGGGRLDIMKAAGVTTLIHPNNIGMRIDAHVLQWQETRTIRVQNMDDAPKNYAITLEIAAGGITASYPETIQVPGNSFGEFNITISVDNTLLSTGIYDVDLLINDSVSEPARIPIELYKVFVVNMTFANFDLEIPTIAIIWVSNDTNEFPHVLLVDEPQESIDFFVRPDPLSIIVFNNNVEFIIYKNYPQPEDDELSVTINAEEAQNSVRIIPRDIDDNVFDMLDTQSFLFSDAMGHGIVFLWFGFYKPMEMNISTCTDCTIKWDGTNSSYFFHYGFTGIEGNWILENHAEDLWRIKTEISPSVGDELCLDIMYAYVVAIRSGEGLQKHDHPFRREFYVLRYNESTDSTNPIFAVYLTKPDNNNMCSLNNEIMHSSFYAVQPEILIRLRDGQTVDPDDIRMGILPLRWYVRFDNQWLGENGSISLYNVFDPPELEHPLPAFFRPIYYFLSQTFDRVYLENYCETEFCLIRLFNLTLYRNGDLYNTFEVDDERGGFYDIFINQSGNFSLISNRTYNISRFGLLAAVNASFVLPSEDSNPPAITMFNLLSRGRLSDILFLNRENGLEIGLYSVNETILNARLFYGSPEQGWVGEASGTGSMYYYMFSIPFLDTEIYNLKLVAEDTSSNTLEYFFQVPGIFLGDINGDKTVNCDDVSYLRDYLENGNEYSDLWLAGDMNRDNRIDETDVLLLEQETGQECDCQDVLHGQCSQTQPLYCDNGELINNCQLCGCPQQTTCRPDGTCRGVGGKLPYEQYGQTEI